MYFDGAYSYEGAAASVLVVAPSREQLKYVVQMRFDRGLSTNNTVGIQGFVDQPYGSRGPGYKENGGPRRLSTRLDPSQ
jgi:hypothetical protein